MRQVLEESHFYTDEVRSFLLYISSIYIEIPTIILFFGEQVCGIIV